MVLRINYKRPKGNTELIPREYPRRWKFNSVTEPSEAEVLATINQHCKAIDVEFRDVVVSWTVIVPPPASGRPGPK